MMGSLVLYVFAQVLVTLAENKETVFVVTIASNVKLAGFKRFERSAAKFSIYVQNLCKESCWNRTSTKVRMLRNYLAHSNFSNSENAIVLLVDSYDVLFLAGLDEIVSKFKSLRNTRVLFSGEHYSYPLPNLGKRFPNKALMSVYPYLNSGGIIGYMPDLNRIVNYKKHVDQQDDQLYYTLIYLKRNLRKAFKMQIDHTATVFMTLAGSRSEIKVVNTTKGYRVQNKKTKTQPPIIHGQGPKGRSTMKRLYRKQLYKIFENND